MNIRKKQLFTTIALIVVLLAFLLAGLALGALKPFAGIEKRMNAAQSVYQPYSMLDGSGEMVLPGDSEAVLALAKETRETRPGAQEESGESDFLLRARAMLRDNGEKRAEVVSRIYTTKRAATFLFSGLSDTAELNGVLNALAETGSVGVFFVRPDDLARRAEDVRRIIRAGMAMGISFAPGEQRDAEAQLASWLETEDTLRKQFGYTGSICLRQTSGSVSAAARTAALAGGYTIVSQMREAVPASAVYAGSGEEILEILFPGGGRNLQRGEIVHFQMGYLQQDASVLGQLVRLMATEKTDYEIVPVLDILADATKRYEWPLPEEAILPEVKDAVHSGQLNGRTDFWMLEEHYIGSDWVDIPSFLPGFSKEEIKRLDTSGRLDNDYDCVFLTFDDWGTDYSIEKLLQVLARHDAKATFFVCTGNVKYNPNLLRAIAEEGHSIASHTDSHFPLSNMIDDQHYEKLTYEQVQALSKDLVRSYQVLQEIVGDIRIDGRPALTRLFRPPTLAMSKTGLATVVDCGFTYSVSGSYSTQDYMADSAEKLAKDMLRHIKSGSILVMHMTEEAKYTAEALEIVFTKLEESGKHFRFVSLDEVLF